MLSAGEPKRPKQNKRGLSEDLNTVERMLARKKLLMRARESQNLIMTIHGSKMVGQSMYCCHNFPTSTASQ